MCRRREAAESQWGCIVAIIFTYPHISSSGKFGYLAGTCVLIFMSAVAVCVIAETIAYKRVLFALGACLFLINRAAALWSAMGHPAQ
jgi:hypothetical protein